MTGNNATSPLKIYVDSKTRNLIIDKDTELVYQFENGDEATSYSVKSDYAQVNLKFDESIDCFTGFYIESLQDEIVVVYPRQNPQLQDGCILLESPYQDGTLATLSKSGYQWGFTTLSKKDQEYIGHVTMEPLLAICRYDFTANGHNVSNIKSVHFRAIKGAVYKNRYLNLSAGTLESGTILNDIFIKNIDGMNINDPSVYVAFFPSAFELYVEVMDGLGNVYEGMIPENKYIAGQYNVMSIELTKTDTCLSEEDSYVEVCGIQWAKGNLIYNSNLYGNTGYQEHWQIAPFQWFYPNIVSGYQSASATQDPNLIAHFNWGVLNQNSLSLNLYATYYGDIAGKLFYDRNCSIRTSDFASAQYGDLAYWATNGRYRLPKEAEMYKLFAEASYSFGYYTTSSGIDVYGFLFKNPDGVRVIEEGLHHYTDEDLENYLFLPASGNREFNSTAVNRIGCCGYYWDSMRNNPMNQLMCAYRDVIWRQTDAAYGRTIRPVKNIQIDIETKNYIEVCGVKWAKGNLQYGQKLGTTDGFQEYWSIADYQWSFPDAGHGYQDIAAEQSTDAVYHFNWGVCGANATTTSLSAQNCSDIAGRMFLDKNCINETKDYSKALYGDVAFWASKGMYRLPTEAEMYKLYSEASYSRGCYIDSFGNKTFGFLFKDPEGQRVIETKSQIYTDYDMDNYLFLPAAGNRQYNSIDIYRIGCCGFYFDSNRGTIMNQLMLAYDNVLWRITDPSYGRTIRPVFNEN